MLRSGRWDEIPDIEERLMDALQAARVPGVLVQDEATTVQALLEKLARTIEACTERKSQISPLVEALSRNSLLNRQ